MFDDSDSSVDEEIQSNHLELTKLQELWAKIAAAKDPTSYIPSRKQSGNDSYAGPNEATAVSTKQNNQHPSTVRHLSMSQTRYQGKENYLGDRKSLPSHSHRQCEILLAQKQREIEVLTLKVHALEESQSQWQRGSSKFSKVAPALLYKQSQGAMRMQLQQAKKTIQQLTRLLGKVPQFRDLSEHVSNLKEMHFITRKQSQHCIVVTDRSQWVEAEAYRFMLAMKVKHQHLSEQCIEEVLGRLSELWINREQAKLRRQREQFQAQIARLQMNKEESYDQVIAKRKINHLKRQLETSKKKSSKSAKSTVVGQLKNEIELRDQLRLKTKEIKLLEQRITMLVNELKNSQQVHYLEGGIWLADKLQAEVDLSRNNLAKLEQLAYERITEGLSEEDYLQILKNVFEEVQQIQGTLEDKLTHTGENLRRKISLTQKIK